MSNYHRKLAGDLTRWREAGWVTAEGEAAIREELASQSSGVRLATVLAILGAVLLGFAAMSFVAANWQAMSKLLRLVLLVGAMGGAYGLAAVLGEKGRGGFAQAAILLGCALFGANIMLIAQMYHMDGNPPDAVLLWAVGSGLAGVVLGSCPAMALTALLVGVWSGWEMALSESVHWPFLAAWAAVFAFMVRERWGAGLHLSAVLLVAWVVTASHLATHGHGHVVVTLIGAVVACAGACVTSIAPQWREISLPATGYGFALAFAGLMALQVLERQGFGGLFALAVLALAGTLAVILAGVTWSYPRLVWAGYLGFSIEVLYLYFRTLGTLMNSSLFFLTAGLVVSGLSAVAWRLHARTQASAEVLR